MDCRQTGSLSGGSSTEQHIRFDRSRNGLTKIGAPGNQCLGRLRTFSQPILFLYTPGGHHIRFACSENGPTKMGAPGYQLVAQDARSLDAFQSFGKRTDKKRDDPGYPESPLRLIVHTHTHARTLPDLRVREPGNRTRTPQIDIVENRGGRFHKSSRTRDESQRIAGQAYSRAYNTPFKSSRLQGIPAGHTVPFHSSATSRPTSGPVRVSHPSHDPDCPERQSIVKSNHAADYISSIYPAGLPA